MSTDEVFLERALEEAKKGLGFTSPNPAVGAVIVKNGTVIAKGYHHKAGEPHAEIEALKKASGAAKGATLYVTLEPCCHVGKTPPCTEAILRTGISRVVVGMRDPFPAVNGKGAKILHKKNIAVSFLSEKSVLYKEIRMINQPFLKYIKTGLPYVTLKAGISLDGAIATRTGESKWITSEEARADARLERSQADSVLVGSGTVLADNPELAPHGKWKKKKLSRALLDPTLASSPKAKVFRDGAVFVATTEQAELSRRSAYQKAGICFDVFGKERVSIPKLLSFLGKEGVRHVFVEGGSGVHGAFVDASFKHPEMVDRILLYVAPKIIGGKEAVRAVGGEGSGKIEEALQLQDISLTPLGNNFKAEGFVRYY